MRVLFAILIVLLAVGCKKKQDILAAAHPQFINQSPAKQITIDIPYQQFYDAYEKYKEPSIKTRRFKQSDIAPLIKRLKAPFKVSKAGQSIEGRDIYRVSIGNGPIQVLLWSQMHGDESTATMALMDVFNFFSKSDELDELRQKWLQALTITFIPMLNPDGAERFTRRNALGIDLNRDALRLQCPEAQILKKVRDELQADWGFNLHDQGRYTGAGLQPKTATFSFLAPAYNYEKEVNETRGDAMQLIALINAILQKNIPGQVGRYDDAFEPRAFGDNIQKWGTRTVLIECGGQAGDPEKQEIRKHHFVILLAAFDAIASKGHEQADIAAYEDIPFNESSLFFDLIVRNAAVEKNGKWYTVDIGLRRDEVPFNSNRNYYYRSSIAEFGDMSIFFGYDELDAKGYAAVPGKLYPTTIQNVEALKKMGIAQLLSQGYTDVRLREAPKKSNQQLPVNVITGDKAPDNSIRIYNNPSFVLTKNGKVRYAVVNGVAFDLEDKASIEKALK